ncbi:GNAT family N-acetyltransferase [Halobacillus locisalis]|uniref:GNAT family N-acetyltransferase n=2 Tax=Halobacillus locisalis TaxID=220753 RepID=A0A838CWP5_9BACI|nr:GNAT family N-acetyltransferase [Halobacillus locisalis]
MGSLGYPTSEVEMNERLSHILHNDDYHTVVYEQNDQTIGMMGMCFSHAYHSNASHVRIIAFVVKEEARGQGIGRMLIDEAERWAKYRKASSLILNSGNREDRKEAHQVYEHFGFEGKSTGFYKSL